MKFYGNKRRLSHREGLYMPNENYAPSAFSPDYVIVNPNCYVWGVKFEYHFHKKEK